MIAVAAMIVVLLIGLILAVKTAAIAIVVALVISYFWKTKTKQANARKKFTLICGVGLVTVGAALYPTLYVVYQTSAPFQAMLKKHRDQITMAISQVHDTRRFTAAIKIADSAMMPMARTRLSDFVLDALDAADRNHESISEDDLAALEGHLLQRIGSLSMCKLHSATLLLRRSGPRDVYQTIVQHDACRVRMITYLSRVYDRCSASGHWHGRCATELPRAQLMTLEGYPLIGDSVQALLFKYQ